MKKILLMVLTLTGLMVKAQYFQHTYGVQDPEFASSGVNVVIPAPVGHFIAGWGKSMCMPPLATISAAYTDPSGNVPGAPFFERNFSLISPTGAFLHARDAKAFQINNNFGFGIVGMHQDFTLPFPNNTGVYYLQLNPIGNPITTFNYTPAPGFDIVEVGGIAKSPTVQNELYITGTATNGANVTVFAMKIDMFNGAMIWSQIYNMAPATDGWGKDIEENPANPFGFPSAAIVGRVLGLSPTTESFLFHIDATNGVPAPFPLITHGMPFFNDEWNSISQALPSAAFPVPGFVLGGSADPLGNTDFFLARVDFLGFGFFASMYDYGAIPGTFNTGMDAIQRFNTFGQDEYYMTGMVAGGVFGGNDALVTKLDQFGVPVAGGEFTYGGPGFDEGRMLDQDNAGAPGPPGGLTMYGTSDISTGQPDLYIVKAYFNGLSGCNESFNTSAFFPIPPFPSGFPTPFTVGNLNPAGNLMQGFSPMFDVTQCFNPNIFGGSNARVAPGETNETPTDDAILVMPNPANAGTKDVTLQVPSTIDGPADVQIYDMLGKQYYNEKHTLHKGQNKLPVDISNTSMAPGMYSVRIIGATETKTTILVVK